MGRNWHLGAKQARNKRIFLRIKMNEILSRDYGLLLLGRTYANANFIYERPFCLHESVFFTHGFGGALVM